MDKNIDASIMKDRKRHTEILTDRQTDTHTHTHTERERERETQI